MPHAEITRVAHAAGTEARTEEIAAEGSAGGRGQVTNAVSDYIVGVNMMCAFGVPGNMIHGALPAGFSPMPVVFIEAYGM